MDPYKMLGITKDATTAEVKKAYHAMSKQYHPDVGGDKRIFQAVNLAYRVLTDPEKRKMYDEHGVVNDESPNHIENLVNARLALIAEQWLDNMLKGQQIPLKKFTIAGFDEGLVSIKRANVGLTNIIKKAKDVREKLSCEGGVGLIHGVIDSRISKYEQNIVQNESEITVIKGIKKVIEKYSYEEVEEVVMNFTSTTGRPAPWSTGRY